MSFSKNKGLALAALLSLGLAACGGNSTTSTPADSSNTEESESGSSSSTLVLEPVVTVTDFPSEIGVGAEHAIDLDDYVAVENADDYTATVISGLIAIEGHVLTAEAEGDFVFDVAAGDSSVRVRGTAVSDNRLELAEFLDAASENYTLAFTAVAAGQTVYRFRTENYISVGSYMSDYPMYYYEANVTAPDGNSYLGAYITDTDNNALTGISFESGIDLSPTAAGYYPLTLSASDFETVYGRDGASGNTYVLSDQDVLSDFFASTILSYWSAYSQTYGAAQMLCTFEGGVLTMDIVNRNFFPIGLTFTLSNAGTTSVPVIDAWLASPVYPTPVDISPIEAFVERAVSADSYHMSVLATWYYISGGTATTVPSGMYDSSGNAPLFNYSADVYVTDEYVVTTVGYASSDISGTYINNGVFTGSAMMYDYRGSSPYMRYGTLGEDEDGNETVSWTSASRTSGVGPQDGYGYSLSGLGANNLAGGNFRYVSEIDDGEGNPLYDAYLFDDYADSGALRRNLFRCGGYATNAISSNFSLYCLLENYLSSAIYLYSDGSQMVYLCDLAYSTAINYRVQIAVDSIGSGEAPFALPE